MKKWLIIFALVQLCGACAPQDSSSNDGATQDQEDDSSAEELIIGGHNVTKKSSLASTTVSLLDTQQGTLCTASLLSADIALTAAHCVEGDPQFMQISFGPRSTGREVRQVVDVATTPVWPQHQKEEFNNGDMALVKFAGGLPKDARTVTLMKASHRLAAQEIVTLAGFGISDGISKGAGQLRTVDVKIANPKYSRTEVSLDQTHQKGACHGDSGGPAFIQNNKGELLLWGITSRGIDDPTDHCAGEVVYTRVQPYIHWMNEVTRSWEKQKRSDKEVNSDM